MAKLIIQTGKLAGKHLTVPSKEVLIGRDEGCYIRMGSPDISRRHCSLRATSEGILVEDLGSSNGTYVNDLRITKPTVLKGRDILRVGPAVFLVDGPKSPTSRIDDDVFDWLTDGDSKTGMVADGDTAIHKLPGTKADEAHPIVPPPVHKPKRVFKTVAEEAQYIIALYQEQQLLKAQEAGKS
jgi:predicted component of type VI protein secretion system